MIWGAGYKHRNHSSLDVSGSSIESSVDTTLRPLRPLFLANCFFPCWNPGQLEQVEFQGLFLRDLVIRQGDVIALQSGMRTLPLRVLDSLYSPTFVHDVSPR